MSDPIPTPARSGPSGGTRYHIATWGCQMNLHDSEKLAGALEGLGYERAVDREDADVILLNTCSIREKAEEKVFDELGRLRPLKEARPGLVIGVCGCVAQHAGQAIFDRAPFVDLVVGARAMGSVAGTVSRLFSGDRSTRQFLDIAYRDDSIRFPHDQIARLGPNPAKAFVTIIEGCNHRCTYCIVPVTRGREICRPLEELLVEVRSLADRGVVEVEFLGQTVNAYRDAAGHTLGDLLCRTATTAGIRRMRFTTSHPAQMTSALIEAMARARPILCPYLHLPVQSGSTRVLGAMRRGYNREDYLRVIDSLRERVPGIRLGTDVIVGFPTETDQEFDESLSLLREVRFDTVYAFVYSPRAGTRAAEMAGALLIPTALARLKRLQDQQQAIQEELNATWVGQDVEVLVEGPSKRDPNRSSGRTPESRVVVFPGTVAPGSLIPVRIERATAYSLRGTPSGPALPMLPHAPYNLPSRPTL